MHAHEAVLVLSFAYLILNTLHDVGGMEGACICCSTNACAWKTGICSVIFQEWYAFFIHRRQGQVNNVTMKYIPVAQRSSGYRYRLGRS